MIEMNDLPEILTRRPDSRECRLNWWWVLLLMGFLVTPATTMGQELDGAFEKAIERAQKRMVKVYGATAGRVDGYASGVVVSNDGRILTMQGVYLDGNNTRVTLSDGMTYPATILRRHRSLQLALLKIDVPTPDFFQLPDHPVGEKGDWVLSLSNAFKVADGVEAMSVNLGVISLRTKIDARLGTRDVAYSGDLVVIDAITSNPGAGGGAVVTADGELVGTIGRVINSSETNTRLNYAVPVDTLSQFVRGELKTEKAQRPSGKQEVAELGVRLFTLGGRNQPAYIDRVIRDSPADKIGLKPDDLIISINGGKVGNIRDYDLIMKSMSPGDELIMIVKRKQNLLRVTVKATVKKL